MKTDRFDLIIKAKESIAKARKEKFSKAENCLKKTRKIVGLSCGSKHGNCEMLLRAAAKGAEEFGVELEIIRAIDFRIHPCIGCLSCMMSLSKGELGKCPIQNDDVAWILEKTVVEDCGLIVSAPIYHLRSNAIFMAITERMHPTMFNNLEILKKTKVGAILSVGGGAPGWTTLGLPIMNIWVQHHRKLVDQVQVRLADRNINWFERAKELGQNVARAMSVPIEEVQYMGDPSTISCPVCHCDVLQIPEDFPYVVCPVCWVHGIISIDEDRMKVKWNEEEVQHHRFSEDAILEHLNDLLHRMENQALEGPAKEKEIKTKYGPYGKMITP